MPFTNKEMKDSTQIAYLSILEKAASNLEAGGRKPPYTLEEMISSVIDIDEAKERYTEETGKDASTATIKELSQYSDLTENDKSIIENMNDEMLNWNILDIHNMNPENGFYACVLEKSKDEAVVAFRGSENMKNFHNLVQDWMKADFGLLNSTKTEQQEEAEKYADELIERGVLDNYSEVGITGHSLGGNLASHFTIACAEQGREELFDKISQCDNLDGPGFSEKYLIEHSEDISKAEGKITHYKWSAVGNLLNDLPNERVEFLDIDHEKYKDDPIARIRYLGLRRHDTKSLVFDEEGNAKRGKQDLLSKALGSFSRKADKYMPVMLITSVLGASYKAISKFITTNEQGKIVFKNPFKLDNENENNIFFNNVKNFAREAFNICEEGIGNIIDSLARGTIVPPIPIFAEVKKMVMNDTSVRTDNLNNFIDQVSIDMKNRDNNAKVFEGETR